MPDVKTPDGEKLKMDAGNLFREETFTDMRTGTITKLTPVKPDGTDDTSKPPVFVAKTQIYTQMGLIPIEGEIEAKDLAEAVEKFPLAVEDAFRELAARIEQRQREASRQIVTPDQLMGGARGAQPPGPGNLII